MSETTPIPMTESLGLPQGMTPSSEFDLFRQMIAAQSNTSGLTQLGPQTSGAQPPIQRQFQQPAPQQTSAFGVGERGAHQRQSMDNLVKASQTLANKFGEYAQAKQNREYQLVIGRFTGATQGVAQAQAQVLQATQALQKNPNDPQAKQQLEQAQQALQQNQAILNDMANDKKSHKIITKAFGVDDKNAASPERAAAIESIKKQMGVGAGAASIMSQIPQTTQLSPQGQQQQLARQAGVIGAPATQGQILNTLQKSVDAAVKAGVSIDKLIPTLASRGMTIERDSKGTPLYNEDGTIKVRPMTDDEVKANPVASAGLSLKKAQTELAAAHAAALTDPDNPELQTKELDAQARMLSAKASMLRAMKYQPGAGQGTPESDIKTLSQQMREGKIAPSELPGFGKVRAQVFAQAARDDPSFNPARADEQWKFANNPAIQRQLATINSLSGFGGQKGSMDELLSLSDKIKRTSFPPVNSAEMAALIASGDPDAAAYGSIATDVADQIGVIMASGGSGAASSDFKLRQAQSVLSAKFNPQQLNNIVKELKVLMTNRQKAFLAQGGPFLKAQMEETQVGDSTSAPTADPNDPAGILK